jgi:hypothetical protein
MNRKTTVGRAPDTRRIADARDRNRPINGGQIHDQAGGITLSGLEDIPAQSRPRAASDARPPRRQGRPEFSFFKQAGCAAPSVRQAPNMRAGSGHRDG